MEDANIEEQKSKGDSVVGMLEGINIVTKGDKPKISDR